MCKAHSATQKSNAKLSRLFAFGALVLAALLLIWVLQLPWSPLSAQKRCAAHLRTLGLALAIYHGDYDEFPPPDKWCDLLIEGGYATEDDFRCPANREHRCCYAINPNVSARANVARCVLLFETEGGWNQSGGPDLLTAANHDGKGSNILFCGRDVEFVPVEQFPNLLWHAPDAGSTRPTPE